jgi:hypothetical protein
MVNLQSRRSVVASHVVMALVCSYWKKPDARVLLLFPEADMVLTALAIMADTVQAPAQ